MAPQDSKIAVEILQSVNNRTQSLRKILRIVITDIVINTLLGRVTLHPAGMHCPSWDDAFVSSCTVGPKLAPATESSVSSAKCKMRHGRS